MSFLVREYERRIATLESELATLKDDPRLQCPLDGPGSHRMDLAELRTHQSVSSGIINTKLLKSCERWIEIRNGLCSGSAESFEILEIEMGIAIAAARAQAADDAKPVDEEWLKSIGFFDIYLPVDSKKQLALIVFDDKWLWPDGDVLLVCHSDGSFGFWERPVRPDGDWHAFHNTFRKVSTRGDVRRLLTALGVSKE